jgi:xeroderma pigmentosum group C-complementing protein
VYPRACVQTLNTRDAWLRVARVVPADCQPVKTGASHLCLPDQVVHRLVVIETRKAAAPRELYGEWQTTAFVPPVASNGRVPRSEVVF